MGIKDGVLFEAQPIVYRVGGLGATNFFSRRGKMKKSFGASDFPVYEEVENRHPDKLPFGFYVMISTCCVR